MKKILLMCGLALSITACSTNDVKITVAEQIKVASQEVIKKELVKSCDEAKATTEAELISVRLQLEVEKLLKVEQEAQKSFVGDIAKFACNAFIEKAIPALLEKNYDEYECAMARFHNRAAELSELICSKIDL